MLAWMLSPPRLSHDAQATELCEQPVIDVRYGSRCPTAFPNPVRGLYAELFGARSCLLLRQHSADDPCVECGE